MHVPLMQRVSQVSPVTSVEWNIPFAMAGIIVVVMEGFKMLVRRRAIAMS